MAYNVVDAEHQKKYRVGVFAEWQSNWLAGPSPLSASEDPAAKPFCAAFTPYKEVMYMPVKKRNGQFEYPDVHIFVGLYEEVNMFTTRNFDVAAWHGAQVKVKVRNNWLTWASNSPPPLELSGTLLPGMICFIPVPSATVKQWLEPNGPFKARVNENLFEFQVELPSIKQTDGKPLQASSLNRVYFYCKKTIAFLPGVFGSQFQLQSSDGALDAFPNFMSSSWWPWGQKAGLMSCDSDGQPLLKAKKPGLLRLKGAVYDTYTVLRKARIQHFVMPPEDFRLYELQLFAYDWRCDLTEAADSMMDRLRTLQEQLRDKRDTDDQIAVAGHSTGGVIMRKMLGLGGADSLISHAFFMNTPFRGAPKALSVMLTGCDPPGGGSMIPFITAKSLRDIIIAAPIAYHLAPSYKYPDNVVELPGQSPNTTPAGKPDIEKQKSELIAIAANLLIYGKRKVVESGKGSQAIAAGSDEWAEYWDEHVEWERAKAFYDSLFPGGLPEFHDWPKKTLASRGLQSQDSARVLMGWSNVLGGKARAFHESSESAAASGAWASKAFIFYSKTLHAKTTGSVTIKKQSEAGPFTAVQLAVSEGIPINYSVLTGSARPSSTKTADSSLDVDQWVVEGGSHFKRRWRISYSKIEGDGTVPLRSLLGFGGPAKVFKPLLLNQFKPSEGGPEHVPAPNSFWAWQRVIEVLQGYDVNKHLATNVDPVSGTES